ncbi:DUF6220 domain-containing protein [Bacillus sp. MRMR6]|uniref:DUF6220 domain-containing protein n=1 Tax=Bacillus sp. MRMR6 TaxID=1928617 RepID=UPI000953500B|nr:DUF6220 domain-containing protein [Bacillus sp. MRMR6]OLS34328.1 hypothetical protein BTR25_22125 [Bacillus sp. MRMR6]
MRMSEKTNSKIQKYSQTLFFLLAWILLLGIVTQISIVGLAVFVDGGLWKIHRAIISFIEFIPALMFFFGCAGGIHKQYRAWSFLLFFFINFQYYTTYRWLGAIHSAFALVIFMISLYVAWGSYKIVVNAKKQKMIISNNFATGISDSCPESINGLPGSLGIC